MADISDLTAYLAQTAANACYPSGTSQPSVADMDVLIYEGWPIPEVLDLDLTARELGPGGVPVPRARGPRANVSVFPMEGTNVVPPQIQDETYVIVPAAFGLTLGLAQNPIGGAFTIQLTGAPVPTEFLTVEIDQYYIASAGGASIAAILNAVAAQINSFPSLTDPLIHGYTASVVSNSLIVQRAAYCVPRLGSQGTLGKVTHKQQQSIMVSVWAPDHVTRTKLAKAIDGLIKQAIVVTMPDTSKAKVCYNRTNVRDEHEPLALYRRDLIYQVEYATVMEFPGTVITSVTVQIAPLDPATQNFIVVSGVA
jgi:hypothetical protein